MEPCDGLSSSVKVFAKVATDLEADAVAWPGSLHFLLSGWSLMFPLLPQ